MREFIRHYPEEFVTGHTHAFASDYRVNPTGCVIFGCMSESAFRSLHAKVTAMARREAASPPNEQAAAA